MNNSSSRIYSLDLLRGLVMVIMALDHTRDFFHFDAFIHDPLDVKTTSLGLYFTRWITHFCAPVFIFLAGISIYLQHLRKSTAELSAFLFKRGAWLILVEVILVSFSWTFDTAFRVFIMQVIWAIGISMVCMSVLVRIPFRWILVLGLVIVFGHNILDTAVSTHEGFWWDLLRNGNFAMHEFGDGRKLVIVYPFLPWLGLMMLGYCLGKLYQPEVPFEKRKSILIRLGLALIVLFVLLRGVNLYGNPLPWEVQSTALFTVLSFLDVHKYPPSLLFLCVTIGPALLFLAWFEKSNNRLSKALSIYGRVPFFYYILHFFMLHTLCMMLWVVRGHSFDEPTPDIFGIPFRFMIAGEGYSLKVVYLIWISVVLALYPLCVWFSRVKQRRRDWWVGYL